MTSYQDIKEKSAYKSILFIIWLVIVVVGCSERKTQEASLPDKKQFKTDTIASRLSINKIGALRFRRSYASNQFREMSNKEYEEIKNSNPDPDSSNDSTLVKKFQELGLVKNSGLLRIKFKSNKSSDFKLTGLHGDTINCQIVKEEKENKYNKRKLIVTRDQTVEMEIEGFYGAGNSELKYLLLDVVPGGYKEIVILNEYYIMNGDNSDLYIYEVKNMW